MDPTLVDGPVQLPGEGSVHITGSFRMPLDPKMVGVLGGTLVAEARDRQAALT